MKRKLLFILSLILHQYSVSMNALLSWSYNLFLNEQKQEAKPQISEQQATLNQKLHTALKSHLPAQKIKDLLQEGADPNSTDLSNDRRRPALHNALLYHDHESTQKIDLLLQYHANIHANDTENETLLHMAVKTRNTAMVDYLLQNGIPINTQTKIGNTPLHHAAHNYDAKLTKKLINHGADPTIFNSFYNTPAKEITSIAFQNPQAKATYDILANTTTNQHS